MSTSPTGARRLPMLRPESAPKAPEMASFAPFVHAYLDCPEVRAMVAETFADFAQRNLSRYPVHLTVACIGGVAAAFEGLLREVLAQGGYRVGRIAASPAEGLIKYHYGK